MTLSVDATYQDGVLVPAEPLPLQEHEKVRVTIAPACSPLVAAYGMMGWKGDAQTLEQIALDPEFLPEEAP